VIFLREQTYSFSLPELTDDQKAHFIFSIKRGIYLEMHYLGLINDEQLAYLFTLINDFTV